MKYTKEDIEFLDKCAISAMQTILFNNKSRKTDIVEQAYKMAETMLKESQEGDKMYL